MATTTPNLGLYLAPLYSYPWGPQTNNNWSLVDTAVGNLANPYKGVWDPTVLYKNGNFVMFSGILWLALAQNQNRPPISNSPSIWFPLSLAGNLGGIVFIDTATDALFTLSATNGALVVSAGAIAGVTAVSSIVLIDTASGMPFTVYVANGNLTVEAGGSGGTNGIPFVDTVTSDTFELVVTSGNLVLEAV